MHFLYVTSKKKTCVNYKLSCHKICQRQNHQFTQQSFNLWKHENTAGVHNTNDDCIPFGVSQFSLTDIAHWKMNGMEPPLMLLLPVSFLLWQFIMSVVGKDLYTNIFGMAQHVGSLPVSTALSVWCGDSPHPKYRTLCIGFRLVSRRNVLTALYCVPQQ